MNTASTDGRDRAPTPRTRTRIRRWSRWQDVSAVVLLIGTVVFVAAIPVGIWLWIAGTDRPEVFYWLCGSGVGVLLIGTAIDAVSGPRLADARFADGHRTVGVIEEVVELPWNDVDGNPTFDLAVRATPPGRAVLRRTLHWGAGDASGPDEGWVGRAVRLRHNTCDPDDRSDVLFDGWPDTEDGR
ncbi:hypothetical protein SAMN05421803_101890 [Nocardiopsis flavescens]|uniref:Uncharacterized protein n=1 Tax=Nocardiopsis flavescens TaxID=758803 RepID=A0A1M6D1A9_9ACTN|nr:hypothetical protein SAMN05421803_101890 [Nocardiopsis flavescens]